MINYICSIAKNENIYINEWCKYHLNFGFEHIYLFDNNDSSTENVENFLDSNIKDKVTIFNVNDIHKNGFQNECYTKFYSEHKNEFDWCAFIDIDEFITSNTFNNINDFLNQDKFKNIESIRLQWHTYGDDDVVERDLSIPVYKFFKNQLKEENINKWCKSIVRGHLNNIKFDSSHFAKKDNKLMKQCLSNGTITTCEKETNIIKDDVLWINHYVTKTLSEFLNQKLGRTDCQFESRTLDVDYFWRINKHTKEKDEYMNKFLNDNMIYAIMCGGNYTNLIDVPKQLTKINGERLVDRTIRLLRENGVDNIVITSNNPIFDTCGVRRVEDKSNTYSKSNNKTYWVDAFYKFNKPTCYLFGDVYYSDESIKSIVEHKTDDILFFSTAKPFAYDYIKPYVEPLAFKVSNYTKFYDAINKCKKLWDEGKFWRHPIAHDVWCVLKGYPTEYDYFKKQTDDIFGPGFIGIHDYSCDIDCEKDIKILQNKINNKNIENKELSKVFGFISWLPDKEPDRGLRVERLNRALNQIKSLFGDVNIMIIAQNWKEYELPEGINAQVFKYDKLGILGARKILRRHFLESNYDYLIMCDDDIMIEIKDDNAPNNYLKSIDSNPNGFMFLQYKAAQLNLCAISRFIYKQEPMVDTDPEKGEGYEDTIFSNLLHYKYPEYEFYTDENIKCIQFMNKNEKAPSTWSKENNNHSQNWSVTEFYIGQFKKGNFKIDKKLANEFINELKWFDKAKWWGWTTPEEYEKFKRKYGID